MELEYIIVDSKTDNKKKFEKHFVDMHIKITKRTNYYRKFLKYRFRTIMCDESTSIIFCVNNSNYIGMIYGINEDSYNNINRKMYKKYFFQLFNLKYMIYILKGKLNKKNNNNLETVSESKSQNAYRLVGLVVDEKFRGKNIGSLLVIKLTEIVKDKFNEIFVKTPEYNLNAVKFYKKHKYETYTINNGEVHLKFNLKGNE